MTAIATPSPSASELYGQKLKAIRRDLRDEYTQPHAKPWIVGFSGGKDSTLLVHLLVECLLSIAPDERRRRVVILSNDTRVESPVFQTFVDRLLNHLRDSLTDLRLPIEVVKTTPRVDESFWVNLLGRGYPSPSPFFRWCTDRMKVRPTSRFIREQVSAAGEAILLLGVRRAESAQRAKNLARHDAAANGRLTPHTDFKGCHVFTPIKDLTTEEVWIALLNSRPPWGGACRPRKRESAVPRAPHPVKGVANRARDVGGKPAWAARAGVWPASSRRFDQIQNLRRTRDLLPPRLLSGQVNLKEN